MRIRQALLLALPLFLTACATDGGKQTRASPRVC